MALASRSCAQPRRGARARLKRVRVALLVGLSAWSCGGDSGSPAVPHWVDPVHLVAVSASSDKRPPLTLDGGGEVDLHLCFDRRRYGVRLEPGSVLRWQAPDSGSEAGEGELTVSGCSLSVPGAEPPKLRVRLPGGVEGVFVGGSEAQAESGGTGGDRRAIELPVPEWGWWSDRKVALRGMRPGSTLELELSSNSEAVVLDEAVLRTTRRSAPATGDGRLVILLSLDTLREKAISALGCTDCSTPNLDRLAGASQLFLPHYAAANWTKPSHASLLSGMLAAGHGSMGWNDSITTPHQMAAEIFAGHGFLTTGIVSDVVWLDAKFGFDRGFDHYAVVPWSAGQKFADALNRMADARSRDHFVFIHTFEPHSDFYALPYEGVGSYPVAIEQRFGFENYGCREKKCAAQLLVAMRDGEIEPLPDEDQVLRFLYSNGVTELDEAVGELIDGLQAAALWEQAMIVVTSDHGEALLEHGRVEHGTNWESVLRVPLMVKWPDGQHAGEVVRRPSSAIDVLPTLLSTMGIETPEHLFGRPLQTLAAGAARPVFSGVFRYAVWHDGLKLWAAEGSPEQLFDMTEDPDELIDLASLRPDSVTSLRALLERRLLAISGYSVPGPEVELTEQQRERLEALGYL